MSVDQIARFAFDRSGLIPNNPAYPLLIYRAAVRDFVGDGGARRLAERLVENGWSGVWENGIFPFHHYHARAHEVLANLGPDVEVQFGGPTGSRIWLRSGDLTILPAGTGHCRLSRGPELLIVGAYPAGQEDWDLKRETDADFARAASEIARTQLPQCDPLTGKRWPLLDYWIAPDRAGV